ncbi:Up-regulated during skeletal muscle growth protein 5-like protein [Dinothrombium tinctorium]|uniref:Up-regulated during skeletal muscle growth protein 5-like protein n=1 Tax=Dinothrombium tinctorium TaxID=1965070 RepID=A0A3S3PIT5_9ACAR|nr:Up-regulated during skeletal muscle growth protein 5-like protein [Dinothrombium tinctorium]
MAGEDDVKIDEKQFKGLARYFNSYTVEGRANTAKATLAVLGLTIAYFALRKKKPKTDAKTAAEPSKH